jgi:DNA-directed RNA polymerase specialized sigma24 family protein
LRPGLSHDLFRELLARLDSNPERAGALYNRHRQRLIHYFSWERAADPEALADQVIDRVARRLHEGEVVPRLGSYFLGVARLVALEERRRAEQAGATLREYRRRVGHGRDTDSRDLERSLDCLEHCLDKLPEDRRELILDYYSGEPGARIAKRQQLAERLGLQPGALRNRALRLRQGLEQCLADCRSARADRDEPPAFDTHEQRPRGQQEDHDE